MAVVKVEAVNIWRFSLRLVRSLNLAGRTHDRRDGFLVELIDTEGHVGWGEISPLPGFSRETLEDAFSQLKNARQKIIGMELPMPTTSEIGVGRISMLTDSLSDLPLAPSVGFGLDSAWLMSLGNEGGKNMADILHPNPLKSVSVNALLSGSREEVSSRVGKSLKAGYRSFKLKIGRQALSDDLAMVRVVREQIGDARLRLDCNRAWTVEETLTFWKDAAACGIDYIEEPLKDRNDYAALASAQEGQHEVPLALDESLTSILPSDILLIPNLKALIIKPTILGFAVASSLATFARENSITPVISSCFESSVGLSALAYMAAAFNETDVPVGLDTLGWMADDLLTDPMRIENGRILISELPEVHNSMRRDLLSLEILDDD